MKVDLQIPNQVLRRARHDAKLRRIPFHQWVTDALTEKLGPEPLAAEQAASDRMKWAGALKHLREETARISAIIKEEFEGLD